MIKCGCNGGTIRLLVYLLLIILAVVVFKCCCSAPNWIDEKGNVFEPNPVDAIKNYWERGNRGYAYDVIILADRWCIARGQDRRQEMYDKMWKKIRWLVNNGCTVFRIRFKEHPNPGLFNWKQGWLSEILIYYYPEGKVNEKEMVEK